MLRGKHSCRLPGVLERTSTEVRGEFFGKGDVLKKQHTIFIFFLDRT